MDGFENVNKLPCRVCFAFVDKQYSMQAKVIQGKTLENVLKSIVPELELSMTKNPILCLACSNEVVRAFAFKWQVLKNEKLLKGHFRINGVQFDLTKYVTDLKKSTNLGLAARINDPVFYDAVVMETQNKVEAGGGGSSSSCSVASDLMIRVCQENKLDGNNETNNREILTNIFKQILSSMSDKSKDTVEKIDLTTEKEPTTSQKSECSFENIPDITESMKKAFGEKKTEKESIQPSTSKVVEKKMKARIVKMKKKYIPYKNSSLNIEHNIKGSTRPHFYRGNINKMKKMFRIASTARNVSQTLKKTSHVAKRTPQLIQQEENQVQSSQQAERISQHVSSTSQITASTSQISSPHQIVKKKSSDHIVESTSQDQIPVSNSKFTIETPKRTEKELQNFAKNRFQPSTSKMKNIKEFPKPPTVKQNKPNKNSPEVDSNRNNTEESTENYLDEIISKLPDIEDENDEPDFITVKNCNHQIILNNVVEDKSDQLEQSPILVEENLKKDTRNSIKEVFRKGKKVICQNSPVPINSTGNIVSDHDYMLAEKWNRRGVLKFSIRCNICCSNHKSENFANHIKTMHKDDTICKYCKKQMKNAFQLNEHYFNVRIINEDKGPEKRSPERDHLINSNKKRRFSNETSSINNDKTEIEENLTPELTSQESNEKDFEEISIKSEPVCEGEEKQVLESLVEVEDEKHKPLKGIICLTCNISIYNYHNLITHRTACPGSFTTVISNSLEPEVIALVKDNTKRLKEFLKENWEKLQLEEIKQELKLRGIKDHFISSPNYKEHFKKIIEGTSDTAFSPFYIYNFCCEKVNEFYKTADIQCKDKFLSQTTFLKSLLLRLLISKDQLKDEQANLTYFMFNNILQIEQCTLGNF